MKHSTDRILTTRSQPAAPWTICSSLMLDKMDVNRSNERPMPNACARP